MTLQQQVRGVLERAVQNHEIAGASVLVRQHGKELLFETAGYADVAAGKPIRRDSIFRLYSQSKPITAAAVMLLEQRGLIDLTEGVDRYLPGFAHPMMFTPEGVKSAPRAPWIYELLAMTAGCSYPDIDGAGQHAARVFEEDHRLIEQGGGMTTQELCNRLGACPLAFAPGRQFRYSTCADILGAVVEMVSGKSYGDFLREELFEPLGMKDTAFWVPEEKRERLVTCYERVPGDVKPWQGLHLAVGDYTRQPAFESGGAGLVSTLDDYAAFAQMLLGGGVYNGRRILSETAVDSMTRAQVDDGFAGTWEHLRGYGYGRLMRICTDPGKVTGFARLGEYGWDGWLGTYFANIPSDDMTILFMTNAKDSGTLPVTRKVRNVVLGGVCD